MSFNLSEYPKTQNWFSKSCFQVTGKLFTFKWQYQYSYYYFFYRFLFSCSQIQLTATCRFVSIISHIAAHRLICIVIAVVIITHEATSFNKLLITFTRKCWKQTSWCNWINKKFISSSMITQRTSFYRIWWGWWNIISYN